MLSSRSRPSGRKRRLPLVVVAAALSLLGIHFPAHEAYSDAAIGTSASEFLGFEIGAAAAGMAGAHTGIASGVEGQFWNPAALASVTNPQIGAMHAAWLQDLKYEWVGYARPISPRWGVGSLGVSYFHLPSLSGVDEFNNPTGEFKVYDMAMTAGYARSLTPGVSLGASFKYVRQVLGDISLSGGAVDLGASGRFANTTIGATIQNMSPGVSYGGASYPLPSEIRIGVGRPFYGGRVLLAADYNIPRDYYRDVRIGTEIRPHSILALRAGYRRELGTNDDPVTGFSFGLGINYRQVNVDYAMTPSSQFDDVHRLSFGYSFGGGTREREAPPAKPEEKEKKTTPPPPAPTGPAVISQAKPQPGAAPKSPPAPRAGTPPAATALAPVPAAPAPSAPEVPKASAPAMPTYDYYVILPGYSSKESARAELKALELLGFSVKHATVVLDPKRGGYCVVMAKLNSKASANEMAASLSRMTFRALVDVVER